MEKRKIWIRGKKGFGRVIIKQLMSYGAKIPSDYIWEEFANVANDPGVVFWISSKGEINYLEVTSDQASWLMTAWTEEKPVLVKPESFSEVPQIVMDQGRGIYCEAIKIFKDLLVMRDIYNQGWTPDEENSGAKIILLEDDFIVTERNSVEARVFTFRTNPLAKEFLENFKEYLTKIKYLI